MNPMKTSVFMICAIVFFMLSGCGGKYGMSHEQVNVLIKSKPERLTFLLFKAEEFKNYVDINPSNGAATIKENRSFQDMARSGHASMQSTSDGQIQLSIDTGNYYILAACPKNRTIYQSLQVRSNAGFSTATSINCQPR